MTGSDGLEVNRTRDPLVGRTLGDFVVCDKLGEGGFGAVYLAEQSLLSRHAVVKVLHARHRAKQQVISRFLREAKLASKLDHPYAAHIYAFGAEPDGLLWIAMELVRGTPLNNLLEAQGPISVERFAPLLDKLCEVLSTAHEQGIVHRDIKPANVMVLARAGRLLPKLLDFGIAKALDERVEVPQSAVAVQDTADELDAAERNTLTGTADTVRGGAAEVTQAGVVMGSPPYMPPEQWLNASSLGPRTDLYALGALTYEALTGKPPFSGRTTMAYARAHAQQQVPPLGEKLPAALDAVMRRAMAKRVEDRYESVLAFGAAFRDAAGLGQEREVLPRLEESARDAALADAPQPIADAVAALDAARNAHQGHEAIGELVATCVHLIGLYALACRTRLGPPAGGDGASVVDTLRTSRRRTLSVREWVDLARALVRPYAERPDTHPMPELVSLCTAMPDPFEAAVSMIEDSLRAHRSEVEASAAMGEELPHIAALLRRLDFLSDYPLVVPQPDVAERWMGTRRGKRSVVPRGRGLVDGQPVLLGREGVPLLALWPLVQIGEPSPGAPVELFLFEGQGRRGVRLVSRPLGFEGADDSMWEWFHLHLLAAGDAGERQATEESPPYRGLASFGADDAAYFVGREREVEALVNRLRMQSMVAVVGPSGAGKSSFVHAGVVPALPERWRVVSVRPGHSPLGALAARVHKLGGPPDLAERCRRAPAALGEALAGLADGGIIVLVVDQFEELFTLCADEDERGAFSSALSAAARTIDDPVRVVLTLRDDFLMRAQHEPALRERIAQGLQLIGTPSREQLERILVEPARRVGYEFDDRALAAEMVAAIADRPGALPLLSFTASKMWELRDRHFKQLPRKVYDAIGGVGGALAQHAEETIAVLSAEEQRLVRLGFRHLVTAEGTRAVLSRAELLAVMERGPAAERVLEKLIAARLLTASEVEGGDRVEVAHEALLGAWPRLVRWRQEDAEGARLRDQLRAAARQWDDRGRPDGLLWRGKVFAELQVWRDRHGANLPALDHAFADASRAMATQGRRRLIAVLTTIFTALLLGSGLLFRLQQSERASKRQAQARVAELYEEQGRQAMLEGDPQRALIYLLEALRGGRDDSALRFLIARGLDELAPLVRTIEAHASQIRSVELSEDGTHLLSASQDGSVALWDLATGRPLLRLSHPELVNSAWFVEGGREIVSYCYDGRLRRFDGTSGKLLAEVEYPGETPTTEGGLGMRATVAGGRLLAPRGRDASLFDAAAKQRLQTFIAPATIAGSALSSDGKHAVLLDRQGHLQLWDGESGRLLWQAALPSSDLAASPVPGPILFSHSGDRVIVAAPRGAIVVFDLASGHVLARLEGHTGNARALALSKDDKTLVSAGSDHDVRIWHLADGAPSRRLVGHRLDVTGVRIDERHGWILSTSLDGSVRLWGVASGEQLAVMSGHRGGVNGGILIDDGALTFGVDGTIRRWSLTRDHRLRAIEIPGEADIDDALFTAAGAALITSLEGLVLQTWDTASGRPLRRFAVPNEPIADRQVLAAESGSVALVLSYPTEVIEVWSTGAAKQIASIAAPGTPIWASCLSADGQKLLTGHADGSARLWDTASGQLLQTFAGQGGKQLAVVLSRDARTVVTGGGERTIRVWDVATGKLRHVLSGHTGNVAFIAISEDGQRIATASADHSARVWSAETGALLVSLEHADAVESVALSRDPGIVATISGQIMRLWDARSGRLLEVENANDEYQSGFRFSPDGRTVMSIRKGLIKLRSVPTTDVDAAGLEAALACRDPFRLRDGKLVAVARRAEGCAE